jgi:hypothetical protein
MKSCERRRLALLKDSSASDMNKLSKYCSITLKQIAVILVLLVCARSQASDSVYWNFDRTSYTVTPTDTIEITATLVNDMSGHFLTNVGGASFTGDMQLSYDFTFGPAGENFGTQFIGLSLAPGESFQFVWGNLTPINGFVPPGTYGPDPAFLEVGGRQLSPGNFFEVVVVPEPSVVALAFLAGICWFIFKVRRWLRYG